MITKQEFVDIINQLKEVNDFVEETNSKARELQEVIELDFFNARSLAISHETNVVFLLKIMFNDTDIISWWIYELDYGRKYETGCFTEADGTPIDVSTAEKLYDYLVENMN